MRSFLRLAVVGSAAGVLTLSWALDAKEPSLAPSAQEIIQRSVEANQRDWNADPQYSYTVTTNTGSGPKTYKVTMLFGSPYQKLVAVNGRPLSRQQQQDEELKFEQAVRDRRAESPAQTARRVESYEKDRSRDHLLMEQLSKAFDFRLKGQAVMAGHRCYYLTATPRNGYQPPVMEARVLRGMRGSMWIDKETFQWVKVRAEVISPVSIEGFLAKVEPGTWFELDKAPVTKDIWLTRRFSMRSRAKVLMFFNHRSQETDEYFDYHLTPPEYLRNPRQ